MENAVHVLNHRFMQQIPHHKAHKPRRNVLFSQYDLLTKQNFGGDILKLIIDRIDIKIPIVRFIREHRDTHKELPIADNVKKGSIVITERALDIGIVGEVKDGKPLMIYSRPSCYGESQYGGIDSVIWYDTRICMSMEDWRQIAYDAKDAHGFYKYWHNRLGIGWNVN